MSLSLHPQSYRFTFEMTVEISSALEFSAGELAQLLTEGLFELDAQSQLFPGITTPAAPGRLRRLKVEAVGYEARGRSLPDQEAYRRGTRLGRIRSSHTALRDRLDDVQAELGARLLSQRMLMAKLKALSVKCRHPSALTDADRTIAETLIKAATAAIGVTDEAVDPVL